MLFEAKILKNAIQQYIAAEHGEAMDVHAVWQLGQDLAKWQEYFDPQESLFPAPVSAHKDFEDFAEDVWPDVEHDVAFFSYNLERAFNACLATISSNDDEDDAVHILFVIHPNLILEKICRDNDQPVNASLYFSEDEVEVIHDLMVSRLKTPDSRLATLAFIKRATEELREAGYTFNPQFRDLESKLQKSFIVSSQREPQQFVEANAARKRPELVLVTADEE